MPTPPGNTITSGLREVLERAVAGDPEEAVLAADLAPLVPDERDVDVGDPLQHLVRPDAVERGEAWEEWDDGLDAHA